ncbi:MAG: T9SS type A sorting domain-containing protein [Prolixibacteraceae bacterium]|nr:T9SS type A sorting domain-containing protein [Prolixibacteraceae bacterium]
MKYYISILLLFALKMAVSQPVWNVVDYTGSTTAYFVLTIDGEAAEENDLLGAFVDDECRGIGEVVINDGAAYVAMQIGGNTSEVVNFRVWDESVSVELFVTTAITSNPGGIVGNPPDYITIDVSSSNTTPVTVIPGWDVVSYTNSTTAYCVVTVNGEPAEEADKIGAFVDGECRAIGKIIMNEGIAYSTLEIQGVDVEEVNFRIWDTSAGEELYVAFSASSVPGGIIGLPPGYLALDGIPVPQLSIAEIQGNADTSPYEGQLVEVAGIVTAIDINGYYLQDANAEWSGIYVYSPDRAETISISDRVVLSGTVIESLEKTQIEDVISIEVATNDLEIVPLEAEELTEAYESVLVTVTGRADDFSSGSGDWVITSESNVSFDISLYMYGDYTSYANYQYQVTGVVFSVEALYMVEPRTEADIVNLSEQNGVKIYGQDFKIYPNPFNEYITIESIGGNEVDGIVISSLDGKTVKSLQVRSSQIETSNLAPGEYIISLMKGEKVIVSGSILKVE